MELGTARHGAGGERPSSPGFSGGVRRFGGNAMDGELSAYQPPVLRRWGADAAPEDQSQPRELKVRAVYRTLEAGRRPNQTR